MTPALATPTTLPILLSHLNPSESRLLSSKDGTRGINSHHNTKTRLFYRKSLPGFPLLPQLAMSSIAMVTMPTDNCTRPILTSHLHRMSMLTHSHFFGWFLVALAVIVAIAVAVAVSRLRSLLWLPSCHCFHLRSLVVALVVSVVVGCCTCPCGRC